MPAHATGRETIRARTELSLFEQLAKYSLNNHKPQPIVELICGGKCNGPMMASENHIVVCGEFRCGKCFAGLVRSQKVAFGVSEEATDEEIMALLEPIELPLVLNAFRLKTTPKFVCIYTPN